MEQSPDMPAFSWYYGVLNNLHVLQQSLRIDGDYHLLSPLVMYPALFALLSLPCAQFRISQWSLFRKLLVLSVLLTWMVITTLYAGILIHGISSRYFLFFAIFSAILAASGLSRILGAFSGPRRTPLFLLLCFGILAFSLKDTERMNSHFALSSEKTLDFVSHSTAGRGVHPALVISNYPLLFSALNGGSISFAAFRSGRSFVGDLVKSGEGSERAVLVIQQLFAVSGGPYPGNEIQEPFSLESLGEFTFDGQLFRLSRLHVH